MLAGFNWELHAWIVPLTFATGWVIGYYQLRRKHPDLWDDAMRRQASQREERKET